MEIRCSSGHVDMYVWREDGNVRLPFQSAGIRRDPATWLKLRSGVGLLLT